jgi:SAM-dependent methyltransferase
LQPFNVGEVPPVYVIKSLVSYERSAPFYDLFGAKDDGPFLAGLAARRGGPVLVAGAGTAREALPLAEAGADVVAFDLSAAMLAVAAGKVAARKLGGRVRLVRADARRFSFRRRFPLVVALNLFDHFVEDADAAAALSRVKAHLAPGGRAVLNAGTPAWRPEVDPAEETRPLPDGRRVTRRVKSAPTTRRNVYDVELWFDVRQGDQLVERYLERGRVRLFRPDEVRRLAAAAGLTAESVHADYAGAPLQAGDAQAIFTFK